jgi:hypothetical protein
MLSSKESFNAIFCIETSLKIQLLKFAYGDIGNNEKYGCYFLVSHTHIPAQDLPAPVSDHLTLKAIE